MALLHYSPPTDPYIEVLYQDNDIVILNKPSGLLTVPGKALEHRDSLQSRVQTVWPSATIVHRLDMATSGLLIMAMNKDAHRHISRQFETRQVKKVYLARVLGEVADQAGSVDLPLICDWPNRPKQMVDHENGKPALTHWQKLQTRHNETLMALFPHTGRSHQLRVHMLSMGHPILGDRLYAPEEGLNKAPHLQLHAFYVRFSHPHTHQICEFSCPCGFALLDHHQTETILKNTR